MIIPINTPAYAEKRDGKFPPELARLGTDEVVLIELQGSFRVEGNSSGHLAAILKLGENDTKPTMTIGHHLLEGKIVNLSKPLAVLAKKKKTAPLNRATRGPDGMDVDGKAVVQEGEEEREYDIIAVVKRKVLFSKRPMPISNTSNIAADVTSKASTNPTLTKR